jgi:hypothetical protein
MIKTIPDIFRNPRITNLINAQIDYGYKSYSALDSIDKELITAECIALLGNDASECITDAASLDNILCDLSIYLKKTDNEAKYDLIDSLRNHATKIYEDKLELLFQELIIERKHEINAEYHYAHGHHHQIDRDTGEMSWSY